MPRLSRLQLQHFRNLGALDIAPGPNINIFYGENGAGKTSILEGISVLAHGRSFRTRKYRNLIQGEESAFTVFGRVNDPVGEFSIGVHRDRSGKMRIKAEDNVVKTAAELAAMLPLIVINSDSFRLIEGSPKDRRRIFDWLVFHVKHDFAFLWSKVSRCIKQRNSLLRRDKIQHSDLLPWEREIARIGREIEGLRAQCFASWLSSFDTLIGQGAEAENDSLQMLRNLDIEIAYQSGWREDAEFEDQLKHCFDRDRSLGYTSLGPHKADIRIRCGKKPAAEILSRGQQKLLIAALFIAEAKVFAEHHESGVPIFAIDDLPSELDAQNQRTLARWLADLGSQIFATGIDNEFGHELWPDEQCKVFHVKHGEIEA